MSRYLRSAFTCAQTASAGPSSQPLRIAHPLSKPLTHLPALRNPPIRTYATSSGSILDGTDTGISTTGSDSTSSSQGSSGGGLFDDIVEEQKKEEKAKATAERVDKVFKATTHKSKTHNISPRKLQMLSKQIAGLPIDEAIIQMQFNDKMAGNWIKSELIQARNNAVLHQGAKRDKLVIAQSWVNKSKFGSTRLDVKGRGRHGVIKSPYANLHVMLKHGKTADELEEIRFLSTVNKLGRSAGLVREDKKLSRKVISGWHW